MRLSSAICRMLLSLLVLSFLIVSGTVPSAAQMPVPESSGEPDKLQALAAEMTPEQRETLIKLIELFEENPGGAGTGATESDPIEQMQVLMAGFRTYVVDKVTGLPDLLSRFGAGLSDLASDAMALLGYLLLSVLLGAAAEFLFVRFSRSWRDRVRIPSTGTLGETVAKLSLRAVLELGGVLIFLLVSLATVNAVLTDKVQVVAVSSFILLVFGLARVAGAVLRFVLAPKRQDLRLVAASDEVVTTLYRNLVFAFAAGGILLFLSNNLARAGFEVTEGMRFWGAFLVNSWLAFTIWRSRHGLTRILIGESEEPTPGLARMARFWPPAMVTVLMGHWVFIQIAVSAGIEVISPLRGMIVVVLILVTPFLDTMIRGIADYLVPRETAPGAAGAEGDAAAVVVEDAVPAVERQTRLSYVRIGRTLLFASAVVFIGKIWGLNLQDLAAAGVGAELAAHLVGAILILACGYLVWEFSNLWINRRLIEEGVGSGASTHGAGGEGGGAGLSRLATILPLVRIVLTAVIAIMTVLLALDSMGINITPLLAGAGVLGLAVGFGAQTLVKDVVSGVFFLLDDAFRVGEFIDAGGTLGAVEKISIRSIQLRSVNGPIHIIPYGEIAKVTNMSRDWVIMKLRFTVPFDTDLDKVRKIFKKIGQEMMDVPELAEGIIEPFKSQGAADVDDVGIIVRGKFMTKPGHQFAVRKEVYSRVQRAFNENGIDFARKEVRVNIPGLGGDMILTPEQENAIAAAASQAAEPPPSDPQAKKAPSDDR